MQLFSRRATGKRPRGERRRRNSARRQHRRIAAGVERLEDRTLLAAFVVNSTADTLDVNPGDGIAQDANGDTTLRAAIMEANALSGDDTITLPADTITLTIGGMGEDAAAAGDFDITDQNGNLTIVGAGAASSIIDAARLDRLFDVRAKTSVSDPGNVTLNLVDVTLTGGGLPGDSGAAIRNRGGTVSISMSRIADNQGHAGGAIWNELGGTVTIADSIISNNRALTGEVGAIFNSGFAAGHSTLIVTNSTISNNSGNGRAGAIATSGTLEISNSTLSGNSADDGGAIYMGFASATVRNTTITNNTATVRAGGVGGFASTLIFQNTIVAGNSAPVAADIENSTLTVQSQGHNLIGDASGLSGFQTTDLLNVNPLLGPLQDNGGPTHTHALLDGSPAIDAGIDGAAAGLDQRGEQRPNDIGTIPNAVEGDGSDIGAFEFGVVVTTVPIDIKPDSDTNPINLGSNGVIPVAIFSTADFDATTVDPTTVTLADAAVKVKGNGTPMASPQDVNGDGLLDLVVHVETQGLSLTAGDVQAILEGETIDGQAIRGVDSVRVIEGLLATGIGGGFGSPLNSSALSSALSRAVSHWATTGADVSALGNLDVRIEDLPGAYLGQAGDGVIWFDVDAAGWGWSIDGHAPSGVDLLTVATHELGHTLGVDHSDDHHDPMAATLNVDTRRADLRGNNSRAATPDADLSRFDDRQALSGNEYGISLLNLPVLRRLRFQDDWIAPWPTGKDGESTPDFALPAGDGEHIRPDDVFADFNSALSTELLSL